MTEQPALTDKERELVAVGAAVGAGCQPCTQYHVRAALESGLSQEDVRRAVDEAEAVRREGGIAVSNVGRRLLGGEQQPSHWDGGPSDREGALIYIGAAAGCNAGSLLTPSLAVAEEFGFSPDGLRSALELAEVVKQHAVDFLRRDAERALKGAASPERGSSQRCCGPEPVASAAGSSPGEGRASCC